MPNDILGNLGIVSGSSHLLMLTDQALAQAQAAHLADHPEYAGSLSLSLSLSSAMVGEFSQGGITAGEFAEQFNDKY